MLQQHPYSKALWLELLRIRMENMGKKHGHLNPRVLAMSKRVDKMVVEAMRGR